MESGPAAHSVQRRVSVAVALLVILATTALHFPGYFDLDKDIARMAAAPGELDTDLTPQFGAASILWERALARGHVAHWNPYILSGTPNLANPQSRFIAVENFLNLFFRGQVSTRLSIPIQIAIGWIGILLLVRNLGWGAPEALIVGGLYFFDPYYMGYHVGTGHVNVINGTTFAPWLGAILVWPGSTPAARIFGLGSVLALMMHAGANTIAAYAAAVVVVVYGFYWFPRGRGAWVALDLALVGAVAAGLAWPKQAPALDFLAISQRRLGMSTELAYIDELRYERLTDHPFAIAWVGVLAVVGLVRLARISRLWFALCVAGTVLGLAYVYVEPVFAFVFETVPGLSTMRIPSRALFLLHLEVGLLAALGVLWLANRRPLVRFAAALRWAAAAAFIALGFAVAGTPSTMVDGVAEREANPVLQYVRRDDDFFRLTSIHDRDRHWGYQHQTIPYGIRTFLGYTAIYANDFIRSRYVTSVRESQQPFVPRAFSNYAAATGLLSVKYVSSKKPVVKPGLSFLTSFDTASEPKPPRSRGPYLYLNERAMPRAYVAATPVAVTGRTEEVRRTILGLLFDSRFRTERFALIAAAEEDAGSQTVRDRCDMVLKALRRPGQTSDAREALLAAEAGAMPVGLPFEEPRPEELVVTVPEAARGRWIILSEKFALFNGWRAEAETAGGPVDLPLVRANHVNTALWIPPEVVGPLRLRYVSPGFRFGMVTLLATVATMIGWGVWTRFRRRPPASPI